MDKNLVVEVFVPEQGTGGERGEIATGYPIARHLILTVQHALHPANGRDESVSIAIRWRHPRVTDRDWQPIQGIAWESEQWGLALLQYELPLELGPWGFVSEQKPTDGMHWVSAGFPRVGGKKQKAREPFDMQGTVYSRMDDAEHFAIEERAGPTREADWKGASGSPVFVNWRILGVIVSVPENLEANRLWAVPMWRVLREDPAFRAKLGYDEREARRASVRQKLAAILAPMGVAALAECFPDAAGETMGASAREQAECVAEHLLELEVGEAIETCQKAYADVKGRKAGDGQAIARAVQIILPAVYDHGVVEGVRHTRGDTNAALIELPAHYPTVAEIIMAGADRRESLFRPRLYEEEFPRGQLNLPAPPEGGFDGDGQRAIAALDRYLTGKLSLAYSDFERAVDDFMVCRFYHSVAEAPPRTAEQKIRGAAREIRYQAERQGKTYYLIVALPANRDDRQRLEMVLRSLRARYPGLVCLTLSHEGAVEEAEFHTFRDFVNLLPKIAESPS